MQSRTIRAALTAKALPLAVWAAAAGRAHADEGMWPFHQPPAKVLEERYGFTPDAAWLEHVRLASVRFNSGGSGSFVSPSGLVLTNHHVAMESIQKLSTPERDLVKDGFLAQTRAEELRCPDLELNVLVATEDVTARVERAAAGGASVEEAERLRKAEVAAIEQQSREATGLRSDVVSLHQGGEYWLYRYRQYTDVRLVFAPEAQAAFFGGDHDNFTYPRWCLDVAFLRAYENGAPAATPHWFRFQPEGLAEGDLVFVSGHPGRTSRQYSLAQLEYSRDHYYPYLLDLLAHRRDALVAYAARGEEEARQAADERMGVENSLKALGGFLAGLRDPDVITKKAADERALQEAVAGDPRLHAATEQALADLREATELLAEGFGPRYSLWRLGGSLGDKAVTIVRLVAETQKPNAERLPEFRESGMDSLELDLYSPAPIHPAMEEALLRADLEFARDFLPADDPFVTAVLGGRAPAEVARALVAGTGLADPEVRRRLVAGGPDAVAASDDALIALARDLDPLLRDLRKTYEDRIVAVRNDAGATLARARFAAFGRSVAPDATFTLRLSFGEVRGYEEGSTLVSWKTTFHGLFERASSFDERPPFELPPAFAAARQRLDLDTPYDFVSTCDIIGGNSGSPTLNRNAELVGLIFDGNAQSHVGNFVYDDVQARAVSVHAAAIVTALDDVYQAHALLAEILAPPAAPAASGADGAQGGV